MKKRLAVIGIVILIIACIAVYLAQRSRQAHIVRTISVHDQVVSVVADWSHMNSRPGDSEQLSVLWATHGSQFGFYPDAAMILTAKMQHSFSDSKRVVLQYTDINADSNQAGKAKTVADLFKVVNQNYEP